MSAIDPEKKAIVQELLSRRDTLTPEKAQIVDELATRFGLAGEPSDEFADVQSGSSSTTQQPWYQRMFKGETGPVAGLKKAVTSITAPLHSPLETAKGIGSELWTAATDPTQFAERGIDAFNRAKQDKEHDSTGLDPYVHAAAASIPFAGPSINEGLMQVNKDPAGVLTEAALMAAAPALLKGGASLVSKGAQRAVARPSAIPRTHAGEAVPPTPTAVGNVFNRMKEKVPSKARAGEKFETVMGKAQDVPIDLSEANKVIDRAIELKNAGSTMPKIFRDFRNAQKPTPEGVTPEMTYKQGRDFASNASGLSSREATALNRKMHKQVSEFAHAMKTANREAAKKVGMEQLYDEAMKEFAKASNLADKAKILKEWAKKGAIVIVAGAAGAKLIGDLTD